MKATRIPKFRNVIYRLEIKDEVKALYSIAVMFIYLLCYVHCTTCIFFYLVSLDKSWIPIKDASYLKTDLWFVDLVSQYFISLYYMVLVLGGNETAPSNITLKLYSAATILFGNIYMANIMGSMANYVSVISRRDNAFETKLDIANSIMQGINISSSTQSEVRDYFYQSRISIEQHREMRDFMELISPSIKQRIAQEIF